MCHRTARPSVRQVAAARRRFDQAAALPFADHLPADTVRQAVRAEGVRFRDRLYAPAVTVWVFLSQVLDAAHCCRQAVARFLAWRVGQGLAPCSANAGAYCKARGRLPEAVLARLVRDSGRRPQEEAPATWRWQGRTVKVADGSTIALPDTPANQEPRRLAHRGRRSCCPQDGCCKPQTVESHGTPRVRGVALRHRNAQRRSKPVLW